MVFEYQIMTVTLSLMGFEFEIKLAAWLSDVNLVNSNDPSIKNIVWIPSLAWKQRQPYSS